MKWRVTIRHSVDMRTCQHTWSASQPREYHGPLDLGLYVTRGANVSDTVTTLIAPTKKLAHDVTYDYVKREQQLVEYTLAQLRTALTDVHELESKPRFTPSERADL